MGGSGGGWSRPPEDIAREVRTAEQQVRSERFQTELSSALGKLLSQYNDRDTALVRRRLDAILNGLGDMLDEQIDQVFGGSVAKHTYVDGLSDIDCLLVVNDTTLEEKGPRAALGVIEAALKERLKGEAEVSAGQLAVTVKYGDGMEIQLLPAVKSADHLKIQSSRDPDQWSSIDPQKFQAGLTKYNTACDGKLVPTIKLAKAIIGQLPDHHQLSGYHIESLAIDAFKGYQGTKTPAAMLPVFFEKAKDRVLQPITDSSGQSVHVDEYMGEANSQARQNASHILGRIAKRIANATASGSLDQWQDLFGENE
jgi:hypothetical protein